MASAHTLHSSSSAEVSSGYKIMHPDAPAASSNGEPAAFNYDAYTHYTPASGATKPTTTSASRPNERSLTISTNAPMDKDLDDDHDDDGSESPSSPGNKDGVKDSQRPEHLKPRLCTVPGCKKRVRSKGLCKAHGGGRRCMVEGCERSSQGQGLCIRHGGGKRCTQPGCTKASQSNGLCKAHGGGLRCQAAGCSKSSQGGGFCRAHGGGQRCEKEGCNKGAQRGGFCAGHGGSRFCQHPDCTKNDRGGGFCAEHGGGKRCDQPGCNKPARKKGKCSYHANANKQKNPKDGLAAAAPPMMDMRQITAPAYGAMNGMAALPKDMAGMRDPLDPHSAIRSYPPVSSYPRVDMDQRYAKGYDQPLPLPGNPANSQYLPMHADQRGYDAMSMHQASRHYMGQMDQSNLPPVSSGYSASSQKHPNSASMAMMDRNASQYNPGRNPYAQWSSKDGVPPGAMPDRPNMDYFDMKDQNAPHHQAYGGASAPYHHHLSAESAAAYGGQREGYYHHPPSGAGEPAGASNMMYNSYGYQPHQMHSMQSMNPLL
ncbi:hypothetical protein Poli38472_005791 [Pythium oligandrum]|uniref:WRKY19-like zinc finger domain-containing protein n=1 Tax=Pythium oligandrum TaxID=41045 RepID=A0A8K1FS88_PYTOL|nr:hypothetical protein Poli38472_005791 [Pythium oligandrum]|eukprot:TMW68323.1 hypothetical protein Poli38472_005791 [Pythium oligandrum]